jgi:hypothetical protein
VTVTRIGYCSHLNDGKHARRASSRPARSGATERVGTQRFCVAAGQLGLHVASHPRHQPARQARRGSASLPYGRVVWHADHADAINILDRDADPDIGAHAPHWRVTRSSRNGLIATGPDCRTRTPTPQTPAGVESEISIHDQP